MKASVTAKAALMAAAYDKFHDANEFNKRAIAEGICWIAETIKEDLKAIDPPPMNIGYLIANTEDVFDLANTAFKSPDKAPGTVQFTGACWKLPTTNPLA
jgi:hypothetical protein